MPFEIIRNDITKVRADAIVNTANPHPVIGAGTDSAIHEAAGPQLLEARKQIGDIAPGGSAATPAFRLKAKYVLHTVTTGWIDGQHGEEEILRKAYASALSLADELKCESVAFPLLSAGSYGFPKELAMSVAIQAFTEFLMSHEMQIILVVYDSKVFSLAGSLFDDVKSFIDDNYVEDRAAEEREKISQWLLEERERRRDDREYRRPYGPRPSGAAPSGLWHRKEEPEEAEEPEDEDLAAGGIVYNSIGVIPLADEEIRMEEASIEEILRGRESTFTEYLRDLIRETGLTDPQIYNSAGMTRQHFNKLINDPEYQPTKRTVYQLIVGMQLDMDKAQKLLEKAGYAMSRSSKFDLIMEYYIRQQKYNVIEIEVTLFDAGLPPLLRN